MKRKFSSICREKNIVVTGAREHNLKNVSVTIPKNQLVVITGPSGSGKSSLAFDTIFSEGQRRYLESLSVYSRQFIGKIQKPSLDAISGLSPTIAIQQKKTFYTNRSTVGTITDIYDFLRLLYCRAGTPHCFVCGREVTVQSPNAIVSHIMKNMMEQRVEIIAPVIKGKKGLFQKEIQEWLSKGYFRAYVDGEIKDLNSVIRLERNKVHDISLVIDRIELTSESQARVLESVNLATELARGALEVKCGKERHFYSLTLSCPKCQVSIPKLEPRNFSFNSKYGACLSCHGIGNRQVFDPKKIIPDMSLSLKGGAVLPWQDKSALWKKRTFKLLTNTYNIKNDIPVAELTEKKQQVLLYGSKVLENNQQFTITEFEGIIPGLEESLMKKNSDEEKEDLFELTSLITCPDCEGSRLRPESRSVTFLKKNISEISEMSIEELNTFFENIDVSHLSEEKLIITQPILKEITSRLSFLIDIGLPYLQMSRPAQTLSGGESQRVQLATQIGSKLVGVLYVLDEPSIGLHQRDNQKLIDSLKNLRDQGNSVLVVEHDEDTIKQADFLIDMGPGAGELGGEIMFHGHCDEITKTTNGPTTPYLLELKKVPVPEERRLIDQVEQKHLVLSDVTTNNLKNISASFPLGKFICVTGVSGSGKSSLVLDTLLPFMKLKKAEKAESHYTGYENIDKIIHVDQSPIGRTPRSNPATYTGVFSDIRTFYSQLTQAKLKGFKPGRFSFNVSGGRCEACQGDGLIKHTMHFLPDVFVECDTCHGKRYNSETLSILYKGKSIADVLAMTITDAATFFNKIPNIHHKLVTLCDVGMGYIRLGQSATTVSGGEAQRIKLAKELSKKSTGKTLYILDEPTTGLHFEDILKLIKILHRLVDQGNTVIVIEHHLDVIKQADYLIDIGPEGGTRGGELIYQGPPEGLIKLKNSHTGHYLKEYL